MKNLKIIFASVCILFQSCSKEDNTDQVQNPTAFNLLFVSNNATDVSFTPTLTWQESTDPNGQEITYEVYLQKTTEIPSGSTPAFYKGNINTNTYTLTEPLLASTSYKWFVKAKNTSGGSTNSSDIFTFTTAEVDNLPPTAFNLLSPANNATDVSTGPILTWQPSTDPEGGPIVYDVYLGENAFVQIGVSVQGTSLPVGGLTPNTTYYWYVQARDNAGNGKNSSIFKFTTEDDSNNGGFTIINSQAIPNQDGEGNGRKGHQMVYYNNKIWVLGGFVINTDGTGGEYNDVWNTSDLGINWSFVKENDPDETINYVPSDEHQVVVFRNEMWVLNGNRNTVDKSTDGLNWEHVPFSGNVSEGTHYESRHDFAAVVFQDRLYIISGGGPPQGADIWSTDGEPDANGEITWVQEIADAPFGKRIGLQAAVFNNKIYISGGTVGNTRMNDVWESSDGANWTQVTASAPFTPRTEHIMIPSQDGTVLWVLFGDGIDPNTGNTVDSLNDVWYTENGVDWIESVHHETDDFPDGFKGRKESAAVSVNGKFYVISGKNGSQLLNDFWYFIE